jgi:hypothetical protein
LNIFFPSLFVLPFPQLALIQPVAEVSGRFSRAFFSPAGWRVKKKQSKKLFFVSNCIILRHGMGSNLNRTFRRAGTGRPNWPKWLCAGRL